MMQRYQVRDRLAYFKLNPAILKPSANEPPADVRFHCASCSHPAGCHKYGLMVMWRDRTSMKTTVEVPDELYRRAKAEAALRGRKLRDLVEEGLRLVLKASRKTRRHPSLAELTQCARGMIDSGTPDLASNIRHLAGFGHDDRSHR
jgi:hypothetical protein